MFSFWHRRKPSPPPGGELRCSFCSKTRRDVRKLIAGPGVVICDECIEVCNDILADDHRFASAEQEDEPSTTSSADVADFPVLCRLCGMQVLSGEAVLIEDRGMLCKPCIATITATTDANAMD